MPKCVICSAEASTPLCPSCERKYSIRVKIGTPMKCPFCGKTYPYSSRKRVKCRYCGKTWDPQLTSLIKARRKPTWRSERIYIQEDAKRFWEQVFEVGRRLFRS